MLLALLVVPVASQFHKFEKTYINESSTNLPSPDTIKRSVVECGVTCSALASCFGFMFDNSVKKCTLLGCLNLYLSNGSISSYYKPMNKLLARGERSLVTIVISIDAFSKSN